MEVGFLQETKSILKSLVLSCPNGMTIERLNRDYREMVGSWIPYQKLGFANLELFLKSVPDTLVVTGHGREARIGFVSNHKLEHMNEMVSRQKNTTRERKVAASQKSFQKSRIDNALSLSFNNSTNIRTSATTFCTFSSKSVINNKSNNSYLYECPPEKYAYQPINGNCLVDRSTSSTIPHEKIRKNNFISEYSKKSDAGRMFYEQDSKTNAVDKQNNQKNAFSEQNRELKGVENEPNSTKTAFIKHNTRKMLSEPNSSKNILIDKNCTSDQKDNSKHVIDERKNPKIVLDQQKNSKISCDEIRYPNKNKVVGEQNSLNTLLVKQNSFKSLCPQNKLESTLDQYDTFKKMIADQKNSEHTSNQQNVLKCVSNTQVDLNKSTTSVMKSVKPQTTFSSERILNHVELPSKNDSKDSSFNNNIVKKINTDPFSQIDSSDNDFDEAVPEFAANNLVFRVDFPENTVAFGRKIPNYELPKELTKGSVVGVFISEIHSPFKFWFHFYKDNHELDILMNRIECFYGRLYDSDLVIPRTCLAPGQVCAALFNDLWHRAEILTNVCKNKVKVHFVDYGTVSEIEIKNIKYLPTIFANTPMQAIRGSLSHIKPISPLWPKRAIKEFLSMVSDVLLYAQIIEIDKKEKTVYMVLCDTNSDETVQINKQLVDRGFAKLDSEWDEKKIAKNGYRKRHPKEIFPTFEMLETGEYPSLFELEQLLAQGIDYEKITEKIILSNDLVLREDCPTRKNTFSFNLLDTNPFKIDIISEIVSLKIFDD